MLTTKKWAAGWRLISPGVLGALLLASCTPPGPRALLDGEKLIQRGDYTQAVEKLKVAVDLLPQNAQAWNHLGLAFHGAGRFEEAIRAYREALAPGRNLAVAHFNLGSFYLERQNYAAAVTELRAYTVLQPQSPPAWLKLGTAQLRLRQFDVAEKSFLQALALDAHNKEVLNALGVVRLYRSNAREAIGFFKSALEQQARFAPALFNLALTTHQYLPARSAETRAFALQKYREYLALPQPQPHRGIVEELARQLDAELNPPPRPPAQTNVPPPARTNLAATRTNENKLEKPASAAKTVASSAVKTVITNPPPPTLTTSSKAQPETSAAQPPPIPEPPPALPPVLVTASSAKPAAEAVHVPAQELPAPAAPTNKPGLLKQLNPLNLFRRDPKPDVLFNASNAASLDRKMIPDSPVTVTPLPSVPEARRYAYHSPAAPAPGKRSEALPLFEKGLQAHRAGRLADAASAYQAALKLDPTFFEAHYNLGLAANEAGDLPLALSAYESALAVDPKSADARYNFSQALRKGNYFHDAAKELEQLLADRPNEARAHLALANLYVEHLQQPQIAREHYQKVLEIEPRHPKATEIRFWLRANP